MTISDLSQMPDTRVFHPRRLGHVNLWVDDMKTSERFYNEVCGLSIEFWETDLVASFLGTGNTPHDLGMIETTGGQARYGLDGLLQIPEGVGTDRGLGHLAWELTNEVELVEGYNQLLSMGIVPEMTVDHQIAHSLYIRDPDGTQVEFYCDTVKEWSSVLHGELKLVTSPWTPGEEPPFSDSRVGEDPEHHRVDAALIHPRRLSHVVLATEDLDQLLSFYTRIVGLDVVKDDRSNGVVWMGGSETSYPCNIVLVRAEDAEQAGYHHASFDLGSPEAVQETLAQLSDAGAPIERVVDSPYKTSFFLIDPDGLRVEFSSARQDGLPDVDGIAAPHRCYNV